MFWQKQNSILKNSEYPLPCIHIILSLLSPELTDFGGWCHRPHKYHRLHRVLDRSSVLLEQVKDVHVVSVSAGSLVVDQCRLPLLHGSSHGPRNTSAGTVKCGSWHLFCNTYYILGF